MKAKMIIAVAQATGCATKQYPQAGNVTGAESVAMGCKALSVTPYTFL